MSTFASLLVETNPAALLGRDPASLIMDVMDDAAHDILQAEMTALDALAASVAIGLPFGPARTLAVQMSPLLCSLGNDALDAGDAVSFIHSWIVGLGDVARTARDVAAATAQVKLIFAENGNVDQAVFDALHPEDQDAIRLYEQLEQSTTVKRAMGGWSVKLLVADARTLAVTVGVNGREVVVGVGNLDADDGRDRAAPKVPQLVA